MPLREPDNLTRLVNALSELDAYYREHPRTRLRPEAPGMAGPCHHLLSTVACPLDVLGAIANKRDFANLLPHSYELELTPGIWIRVLDRQTLITTKRRPGGKRTLDTHYAPPPVGVETASTGGYIACTAWLKATAETLLALGPFINLKS